MGISRVDFDEVRKNCAGPELVCVLVSRFLKFPIQMNLSEKDCVGPIHFDRARDPSGVGGYMRKRNFWMQLKAFRSAAHSAVTAQKGLPCKT